MIVQSSRLATILFHLPAYAKSGARSAHSGESFFGADRTIHPLISGWPCVSEFYSATIPSSRNSARADQFVRRP